MPGKPVNTYIEFALPSGNAPVIVHHRHLVSLRSLKPLCLDAQSSLTRRSSTDAFLHDEREDVVQRRLPSCAHFGRSDVGANSKGALENAAGNFGARGEVPAESLVERCLGW